MENKMVFMIVTNEYRPDVRVHKEAIQLLSLGYDVTVLAWDRANDFLESGISNIDGITIVRFFPKAKYGSGFKQIFSYFRFILGVLKYIREKKPEYLHFHDLDGIIISSLLKRRKYKIIFDMHEYYGSKARTKFGSKLIVLITKYYVWRSQKVIYVNDFQIRKFQKYRSKLYFLPNYPILSDFNNITLRNCSKLRISFIGNVRLYNELKMLIDTSSEIQDVFVSIIGSGIYSSKLANYSSNYDHVNVEGAYAYKDISKYYSMTDLVYAVYNNKVKNWKFALPVKLLESIAAKKPVIVNDGSYASEFVKKHNIGFVIKASEPLTLKKILEELAENKFLIKEKIKNIEKIRQDYSWEKVSVIMEDIYE